jgi:universal stress protein A
MRTAHSQRRTAASSVFERILLPIDLSDRHSAAIDLAARLIGQPDGAVVLFHVIEEIAGLSSEEGKGFYGRLEKAARKHLDRLAGILTKRKVSCRAEVVYGHRAAEVIRYASEAKTDLIIATAPRVEPKNVTAGWGSLSYKISLLSPCPVLLVK